MGLERIWAGWRMPYMRQAAERDGEELPCVFCQILASDEGDEATYVVWRGRLCFAVLNAFPYTSGHMMVVPYRHVGDPTELTSEEAAEIWSASMDAIRALQAAYRPDGLNLGVNLGRAAGAGVTGHFHLHVLGRWTGDANFVASVAEARVLPEALPVTWEKLKAAWPA
jgi:ATP adenylyltransferase